MPGETSVTGYRAQPGVLFLPLADVRFSTCLT